MLSDKILFSRSKMLSSIEMKKIDFFNLEKASDKLISYDKNPFFFFTKI